MASSQVEIVNSALQKCAEGRIASMDEDSRPAREANSAWNQIRQSVLRMYRWNFCKGRAVLAPSSTIPLIGFNFQFPVPADFLALIGVFEDDAFEQQYTGTSTPYVMEADAAGNRMILCDDNPLYITYVRNITDTAQFDPLFDQVMSCHLALHLAYPLATSIDRIPQIEKELIMWERRAKFANAIESTPEVFESSTWIDSRFQGDNLLRQGPVN